jgi:hypothetical protein
LGFILGRMVTPRSEGYHPGSADCPTVLG